MKEDRIEITRIITVDKGQAAERIDVFLARLSTNTSRTKVQEAVESGRVIVNGKTKKSNYRVKGGDSITVTLLKPPPVELLPENIPLNIVYEDDDVLVINKPVGMVSHPGYGNRTGTLINAVLYHVGNKLLDAVALNYHDDEEYEARINRGDDGNVPELRPGIVHRLDKDTSGIMLVAKNFQALHLLAQQFSSRTIERRYWAVAWGKFEEDFGRIEANIARSKSNRKMMSVVREDGKIAITNYKVLERFDYTTLLEYKLETGRTHQIRVHSQHTGHPLFGDKTYGGDKPMLGIGTKQKQRVENLLEIMTRQALHAKTLGFKHPTSQEFMSFDSELPEDMQTLIEKLRN